jgi:ketosteroid isomerase-like protein
MPKQGVTEDQGTRNVEVVRATYDALNRRDIDRLVAMFHEDFEMRDHGTGYTQRPAQFRAWLTEYFESWERYRETPEHLVPVGDRVVACVRAEGIGRRSRADMRDQHGEVHTLRDGRIVSIDVYPTYALAAEAVGLDERARAATDRSAGRRGGRLRRWRR